MGDCGHMVGGGGYGWHVSSDGEGEYVGGGLSWKDSKLYFSKT